MDTEEKIKALLEHTGNITEVIDLLRKMIGSNSDSMKEYVNIFKRITRIHLSLIFALAERMEHVTGFDDKGFCADCQGILDDNATPSKRVQKFIDKLDLEDKVS